MSIYFKTALKTATALSALACVAYVAYKTLPSSLKPTPPAQPQKPLHQQLISAKVSLECQNSLFK
jgi:hypothetical protein